MVEIDYNKRAFLFGVLILFIGVIIMIIGYYFDLSNQDPRLLILGGLISLVAILCLLLLGGLIFALQAYSEEDL